MTYPRSDGTQRPYRIWDEREKKPVRWRCYASSHNAHNGALLEAWWAKMLVTLTVYNSSNGRGIGQYTTRFKEDGKKGVFYQPL